MSGKKQNQSSQSGSSSSSRNRSKSRDSAHKDKQARRVASNADAYENVSLQLAADGNIPSPYRAARTTTSRNASKGKNISRDAGNVSKSVSSAVKRGTSSTKSVQSKKKTNKKTKSSTNALSPVSVSLRLDGENDAPIYVAQFTDGTIEAPVAGASLFMPENHSYIRKLTRRLFRYIRKTSRETWNSTKFYRTLRSVFACVFFYIAIYLLWDSLRARTPQVNKATDTPHLFSADNAFKDLTVITKEPHPSSSEYNLFVRKFLYNKLRSLKSSTNRRIDILDNDSVNVAKDGLYFESSNVIARLYGTQHELNPDSKKFPALILNAHFDSSSVSYGATDDGIGCIAMIELLRTLLANPPTFYDLVLLFNDGEEGGLFGSAAFSTHPWFNDSLAIINMEGSGIGTEIPSLFRSNSYDVLKKYLGTPFPRANVILQNIMRFISSDTDFTVFDQAGIPGIDIAYISGRNLYHTSKDDIHHVTPSAIQALGDNIVYLSNKILNDEIAEYKLQPATFYDLMSRYMILFSSDDYAIWVLLFLGIVITGSLYRIYSRIQKYGLNKLFTKSVLPIFEGFIIIVLFILVSLLIVYPLILLKFKLNRESSYAQPWLNFWWIASVIITWLLVLESAWPGVSSRLFSSKKSKNTYISLPSVDVIEDEESDFDYYSDDDDKEYVYNSQGILVRRAELNLNIISENQEREEDDSDVSSANESLSIDGSEEIFDYNSEEFNNFDTQESSSRRLSRRNSTKSKNGTETQPLDSDPIISSGPTLSLWMPYSLLTFWSILLAISAALEYSNIDLGLYFIRIYALWSIISVVATSIAGWFIKNSLGDESFIKKLVKSGLKQSWAVNFFISSFVPTLHMIDIIHFSAKELPHQNLEGTPSSATDMASAVLVILTVTNTLGPLSRNITRRLFALVTFFLFLILYVSCIWSSKRTSETPQRVLLSEFYDISTPALARTSQADILIGPIVKSTKWGKDNYLKEELDFNCINGKHSEYSYGLCSINDSRPPKLYGPDSLHLSLNDIIDISVKDTRKSAENLRDIDIEILGPPFSRACVFETNSGYFADVSSGSKGSYPWTDFAFHGQPGFDIVSEKDPNSLESHQQLKHDILEDLGLITYEDPNYPDSSPGQALRAGEEGREFRKRISYRFRDYSIKDKKRSSAHFTLKNVNVTSDADEASSTVIDVESKEKSLEVKATCFLPADGKNSNLIRHLFGVHKAKNTFVNGTTILSHKLSRPQTEALYKQVYNTQKAYDDNLRKRLHRHISKDSTSTPFEEEYHVGHAQTVSKKRRFDFVKNILNSDDENEDYFEEPESVVANIATAYTEGKQNFVRLNRPSLHWKWVLDTNLGSYTGGLAIHRRFKISVR